MSGKANSVSTHQQLPLLIPVEEIQTRLAAIFPDHFPNRSTLVGVMAARVVFVFLYGASVEGYGLYLRPSHIYLFTEEQAQKTSDADRLEWIHQANKAGFRPKGERWYADTSREPIRDDLMRNELHRLGIMQKKPGSSTTSSSPINFLSADFAALFAPNLADSSLRATIESWSLRHLDKATQQRMTLRARGISAKSGDLFVDLPDGTRISITPGPSSIIAKDVIEQFAKRHLKDPALLWLSASDKKSFPQFAELSASVGLRFDLNAELPDVILADMDEPVRFVFCEVVATDGPVTEARKRALLAIVNESKIPESTVEFLTAFEDREAQPFRKLFSKLAVDSTVWFRTEPDLLLILSRAGGPLIGWPIHRGTR